MRSPKWGEPARKEYAQLLVDKTMIVVDSEVAREAIRIEVFKVRLVADGRSHTTAGASCDIVPFEMRAPDSGPLMTSCPSGATS